MTGQLVFDLPHRAAMGREDFFVSEANVAALRGLEDWRNWSFGKMILTGPQGAGKTHLAHVWAGMAEAEIIAADDLPDRAENLSDAAAVAVEDADRIAGNPAAEEALFHLHNALGGRQAPLLLTARDGPERWGLVLPDLKSRMAQAGLLRMDAPDDGLLSAVMVKLAHDRGLSLTPALVTYAVRHMDRSFAALDSFVAALDKQVLTEQRAPTRDMAKSLLSGQ